MSRNLLAVIPALLLGIPSLPMFALAGDSPESLHCSPCSIQEGQRLRLTVLAPEAAGERVTLYSAHHVLGHLVLDGGGAGTAEVSLPRAGAQWVRAALPGEDAGPKVRVFLSGRVERRSWNSILVDLNEDGESEEVGPYGASAVVVDGDWDLDTHTDLAVASGGQVEFWYGDGKGGLQQRGAAELGVLAPGEPVGDLNGDGRADFVFVTNRGVEVLWGSESGERKRTSVDLEGWEAWRGAEELVLSDRAGSGLVDEIVRRGGGREERWVRTADRGFRKWVVQAAKPKDAAARMAADSYATTPWGTYFYGQINTIAGNGTYGYSGDGGAATEAQLNGPSGIAVDAAGDVYFADTSNNRIRKIQRSSGIISTVSTAVPSPADLHLGPDGFLYVASKYQYRVYRVDVSTGSATVVAGTGTQGFSGDGGPAVSANIARVEGIFVDSVGNLYLALSDYRVRKVNLATGIITTVAGTGVSGTTGDGGPATSAQLSYPVDVVVDSAGNYFILGGGVIRRISAATGAINTWLTSITGNSMAIDSAGSLYVCGYSSVSRISTSGGVTRLAGADSSPGFAGDGGPAVNARLYNPAGLAVATSGDLFIADTNSNRIRFIDYSSPQYSISTTSMRAPATAGNGSVTLTVSAPTGGWTATSDAPWLTVTPSSGSGTATLTVNYEANASLNSRAGVLAIGPFRVSVIQSAAHVTISPATAKVGTAGGGGTITVAVTPAVAWTATTTDSWLSVTPTSGSGNATLTFTAAANAGVKGRMASVTVAGRNFAVAQAGAAGGLSAWSGEYGQIVRVAGTGVPGYGGDGGAALNAQMHWPRGSAMDAAGNIYVADSENHRVRKVDHATRTITTIAGSGIGGYFGDGGPAVFADLRYPSAVAVDGNGDVYIADNGNNRIRKVSALMMEISTVPTGPIADPSAVALGRDGDLYFLTSEGVYRVLKASGLTERVGQISGSPLCMALDASGDVYFGSQSGAGGWVQKLWIDTGMIDTIYQYAGGGETWSPRSLSVDAEGNVFVLGYDQIVRRINAGDRTRTVIVGGGHGTSPDGGPAIEAMLNATAVTADPFGNVFIADAINDRLRMVDLTSPQYALSATDASVSAVAGSGQVNLTVTPGSGGWQATSNAAWLTVAPASGTGNATLTYSFTANLNFNSREGVITVGSKQFRVRQAGPKVTFSPAALALPPTGGSTQVSFTIAPAVSWVATPIVPWVTLHPSIGAGNGTVTISYTGNPVERGRIGGLTIGDQTFYFTQAGLNGAMTLWGREFGQINTIAGNGVPGPAEDAITPILATKTSFNYPADLAVDEAGNVYVVDSGNGRVRLIDFSSGFTQTFVGGGMYREDGGDGLALQSVYFGYPRSAALHRSGDLFIAEDQDGRIRKVDSDFHTVSTVWKPTSSDPYTQHPSIAVDADGNLYMAEPALFRVRKLNPVTGETIVVAGNGLQGFTGDGGLATQARFNRPMAVAVDPDGNLYITDSDNKRVRRVSAATGIVTTVAGNGSGTFSGDGGPATAAGLASPGRLAVDAAGNLFIAETGRVRRVDAATGNIQTIAGGQSGSGLGDQGLATQASLGGELGITVDGRGNLYIADRFNHIVRFVDRQSPTYTISTNNATVPALGGSATFNVTVNPAGSSWGATSDATWVTFDQRYGAGSGTVTYNFTPNLTGGPRTATIRVGAQKLTVLQSVSGPDKIGVYANGEWAFDLNGNGLFDGNPTDKYVRFGVAPYKPVLGDWGGTGRRSMGIVNDGMWYLDLNQNRQWDGVGQDRYMGFGGAGWKIITGDWNGDGRTKVGIYKDGVWFLDWDGDGQYASILDRNYTNFGCEACTPVVGDWNNDEKQEIGVYFEGSWYLDMNGNGTLDGIDKVVGFGVAGFEPLVGDWNGDGRAKIGIYRDGEWYLDYNGNFQWEGLVVDRGTYFGAAGWKPVTGDWNGDGRKKLGIFRDGQWYLDFNGNFQFDGAATDRMYSFGAAGQTPIVGIW